MLFFFNVCIIFLCLYVLYVKGNVPPVCTPTFQKLSYAHVPSISPMTPPCFLIYSCIKATDNMVILKYAIMLKYVLQCSEFFN